MNVRKPIITGLISLATLVPCKAQKAVQFASETGVTGEINKELSYFSGIHGILSQSKNQTDIYCGMVVDAEKHFTFESQLENEYGWAKNISSWVRETFHLSNNENNLLSEVAPLKVNASSGKFDGFFAPVYMLHNDFKGKESKQGVGLVLNSMYNIDSNNALKLEAEYTTEPAKNLFNTHFGKLKDSISLVFSYIRNF